MQALFCSSISTDKVTSARLSSCRRRWKLQVPMALCTRSRAKVSRAMQMLLRLGDPSYPATLVMDNWLKVHVPVIISST